MGWAPGAKERAVTRRQVILEAMAGKITWGAAAEILQMSLRSVRRLKWGYKKWGFDALYDRRRRGPSPDPGAGGKGAVGVGAVAEAGAGGRGGAGVAALPGEVPGLQRAPLSRLRRARPRGELLVQLREEGATGSGAGAQTPCARAASQEAGAEAVPRGDASPRREPARVARAVPWAEADAD